MKWTELFCITQQQQQQQHSDKFIKDNWTIIKQ